MTTDQLNTGIALQASLDKLNDIMATLLSIQQHWQEGKKVGFSLSRQTGAAQQVSLAFTSEDDNSFLISTPLNMLIEQIQKEIDQKTRQLAAL